jgi:pyridoxal phosphate enzyme (YggS family)
MTEMPDALPANLRAVHARIESAALAAGREPQAVTLVAVSKTVAASQIMRAAQQGQIDFGENYVQEMLEKQAQIAALIDPNRPLQWHFIGPIQSNKTRALAEHCDWIHSVERVKIAQRLSEQRPPARGPLNVLIQVNISGEASKSGAAPDEVAQLARAVAALPRLRLRGLMAIPEPEADPQRQRAPFERMRALFDALRADGLPLDCLSMGMSDDMDAAIAAGATLVRVGTAIFGRRQVKQEK